MACLGRAWAVRALLDSVGHASTGMCARRSVRAAAAAARHRFVTAIAKLLGVSPGTLYNHVPDLRELRAAGRVRAALPASTNP